MLGVAKGSAVVSGHAKCQGVHPVPHLELLVDGPAVQLVVDDRGHSGREPTHRAGADGFEDQAAARVPDGPVKVG